MNRVESNDESFPLQIRRAKVSFAIAVPFMVQLPRVPDIESQRAAMKRLSFLVGKWAGEARLSRGSGESLELIQTEEAQFKLDGLLLVIEGIGRHNLDGHIALQALGIVSYDDEAATYRMRAFNDGRYLESEVKLLDNGTGITWGFTLGEVKTHSTLQMNEKGEWTELTQITIASQPPTKLLELTVRPRA